MLSTQLFGSENRPTISEYNDSKIVTVFVFYLLRQLFNSRSGLEGVSNKRASHACLFITPSETKKIVLKCPMTTTINNTFVHSCLS